VRRNPFLFFRQKKGLSKFKQLFKFKSKSTKYKVDVEPQEENEKISSSVKFTKDGSVRFALSDEEDEVIK